ncbi:MAG: nitrite/sulfite reductase [Minwuia sp.]|uniref:nitrite/sulfite reductase n=1 Tax=Minwuia sp. TaxID=2493630 RepID=UPI003A8894BC
MYQYDHIDRDIVSTRVAEFRDQVARRVSGELTEEEFRPLRLMNGLYLQLHAYMLRVAVPYGMLSSDQMRKLARIARVYDRGYGHFTTRQNIQYNWPKLEETPDILAELAEVEMHAIQTSGNCIRNTTADQFAGATAEEIDDPRVWSEIIRQWSTFHPEFAFLPRKFKIAVTGAEKDRAAIKVHDIGIVIVKNEKGETGFQMWAGGGQGRTPMIAKLIRGFVAEGDLLSYLEAMLRVYNRHGRRDNKYKARIKILVHEIGADEYARQVDEEWERIRDGVLELPADEVRRIRAHFAEPPFEKLEARSGKLAAKQFEDRAFARWLKSNVKPHKKPGYAIANISLKPVGGIPGDATAEQMDVVADLADRYSFGELRVAHEQNLVLAHVKQDDLYDLWTVLGEHDLDTPNIGLLGDIIACPGLDYCSLANARSIPLSQAISERFGDLDRLHDIGEATLNISGCINACGHHHVANIGILGVDKKGVENYQITLGGRADEDAAVGKIVGRAFEADEAVDAIETIIETYVANRRDGERFIETFDRIGINPFKEALYGAA